MINFAQYVSGWREQDESERRMHRLQVVESYYEDVLNSEAADYADTAVVGDFPGHALNYITNTGPNLGHPLFAGLKMIAAWQHARRRIQSHLVLLSLVKIRVVAQFGSLNAAREETDACGATRSWNTFLREVCASLHELQRLIMIAVPVDYMD